MRTVAGAILIAAAAICFAIFGASSSEPSSEIAALAGLASAIAGLILLIQGIVVERRQRQDGK